MSLQDNITLVLIGFLQGYCYLFKIIIGFSKQALNSLGCGVKMVLAGNCFNNAGCVAKILRASASSTKLQPQPMIDFLAGYDVAADGLLILLLPPRFLNLVRLLQWYILNNQYQLQLLPLLPAW